MSTDHKLAAILFADIAGYTALMQKNEQDALGLLNQFKEVLENITPKHQGRIVQYFGDGCLLSFDSSSNSVDCAIGLQKAFGETPLVPVRIGLHLGDVIFRNENVFGDGVNIASRIESLGIPGAILMSKTIRDQIKNKTDFLLVSLGSFEFKNVDEPMEIFAVANPGFVVPKREEMQGKLRTAIQKRISKKWLATGIAALLTLLFTAWYFGRGSASSPLSKETREKAIAVMSFENQTQDKSLDAFGLMAKDWLSQALLETGKAHVIKENEGNTEVLNKNSNKTALVPRGAEILIKGRYYNQDTTHIALIAEIIDAKTNSILYSLKPIVGEKSTPMKLIDDLQQKILGYWVLGDKLLGKIPPKYDAYEAYLQAIHYPSTDYPKKEKLYRQAITSDSTFLSPYLALVTHAINSTQPRLLDSIMTVLADKESEFTDYEKLKWQSLQARVKGDFLRSADLGWELYEKYHIESGASQAMSHYRAKNYLHKTIEKFHAFKPVTFNPAERYQDQIYIGETLEALANLGQYDTVLNWIEHLPYPVQDQDIALMHLSALVHKNKMQELDNWLEKYKYMPLQGHGYYTIPVLYWRVCNDLYLLDRKEELNKYLDKFEKNILENPKGIFYHYYLAIIAYMRNDYAKAYEQAMEHYRKTPQFVFFTEFPGVCLVKMGKKDAALKWMEDLEKKGSFYPGQLEYALGVIESHLGNNEEALRLIKLGFTKGFDFDFYCYREDFLLKDFINYPPFREFTEPK